MAGCRKLAGAAECALAPKPRDYLDNWLDAAGVDVLLAEREERSRTPVNAVRSAGCSPHAAW
jgi:hypothetical protein